MVAPALAIHVKIPTARSGEAFFAVVFYGEQARVPTQRGHGRVGRDDAAALAAGDVLDPVKAEADHVPERTDAAALPAAAEGVRRVFVRGGKGVHGIEIRRIAGVMHRHDRARARSEPPGRVFEIDGSCVGPDFTGHGRSPSRADRLE